MKGFVWFLVGLAALFLVGCASAPTLVWERPDLTPAQFRRDTFVCAQISQKFVAGTMPAGPRDQALYARCMTAHGYTSRPAQPGEEVRP